MTCAGQGGRRIDNFMVNNQDRAWRSRAGITPSATYNQPRYINDQEAENIYLGNALAAKIVNSPVEDGLMRWRTFEGASCRAFQEA